jgi:hypothetical protein
MAQENSGAPGISRRSFVQATGLAAGAALLGSNQSAAAAADTAAVTAASTPAGPGPAGLGLEISVSLSTAHRGR